MKILQVIERLGRGGAERLVVDSAGALTHRGVVTRVVHREGPLTSELRSDVSVVVPPGRRFAGWSKALNGLDFDVMHVHSLAPLLAARAVARRRGVPLLFSVHAWSPAKIRPAVAFMKLAKPDVVVAVSRGVQQTLEQRGVRSVLMPNAVPDLGATAGRRRSESQAVSFVAVGRLEAPKRHDLMLQAFARVVRQSPRATLALVGEGSLESALKTQAAELGIQENVSFLGFQNPHSVLEQADCFVSTSAFEGLALAQVEALMHGLPMIVTDTNPLDPVVDCANGSVVPVGDVEAIANAMCQFISKGPGEMGSGVACDMRSGSAMTDILMTY